MCIFMCKKRCIVRTNIVLDEKLVNKAMKLGKAKTKRELIQLALEEYVKNLQKKNLIELKGKIEFAKDYDYKSMRI